MGRTPANQEIRRACLSPALQPGSGSRCLGWISLSPKLSLFHVPPSADMSAPDNGLFLQTMGRASSVTGGQGPRGDNRLSESSGRVGAAGRVPPGSLLKGTIYRTRSLGKMDALGSGGIGGPLAGHGCRLTPYLLYRPPGPPAATAPASRPCLMKKQTVTPKLTEAGCSPRCLSGSTQPGPPWAGSPEKKGLIHPLRWKLAFSGGNCVTDL